MKINVNGVIIETERKSIVNDDKMKMNEDNLWQDFIRTLTKEEKEKLKSLLSE